MEKIHMILALDSKNGIGKNGDLAWKISKDMKHFKSITIGESKKQNAVMMGRKTWDSIPEKYRPLPGRINAILSRKYTHEDDYGSICKYNSFESAIEKLSKREDVNDIFIIGGAQIYNLALKSVFLENLYLTRVEGDFNCDIFINSEFNEFNEISIGDWQENKDGVRFRFEVYTKR